MTPSHRAVDATELILPGVDGDSHGGGSEASSSGAGRSGNVAMSRAGVHSPAADAALTASSGGIAVASGSVGGSGSSSPRGKPRGRQQQLLHPAVAGVARGAAGSAGACAGGSASGAGEAGTQCPTRPRSGAAAGPGSPRANLRSPSLGRSSGGPGSCPGAGPSHGPAPASHPGAAGPSSEQYAPAALPPPPRPAPARRRATPLHSSSAADHNGLDGGGGGGTGTSSAGGWGLELWGLRFRDPAAESAYLAHQSRLFRRSADVAALAAVWGMIVLGWLTRGGLVSSRVMVVVLESWK